ncbi:TetR/AcrR family transcriptional regulator [Allonocardiopsis opalescens]|uniref:TetR family transcriptional regulator n=1 Tax=Allonocardiopsis opalescens TaxID=1144618 RepID=A0A2T0Q1W6_9ACTN|nr:TetR family transcriptional regulator [Allonocardiopsis opalescens]PRX97769.1 TetR family transcriptional regulator [Allonocardiopsis opalescens]
MPPPNTQRREQLADAAIEVLAGEGARGLTHRAVDAAAGAPPGTASRYFRTREALVRGVVERVTARVVAEVDGMMVRPVGPDRLEEVLTAELHRLLTVDDSLPAALLELHLESRREPALRGPLAEATAARAGMVLRQCRAAGVDLSGQDALLLEMTTIGILFTAMTARPDDLEGLLRAAVRTALERHLPGAPGG